MTNRIPFKVGDFLLADAQEVDFEQLDNDNLLALVAEYGSTNPLLASFSLFQLVARAGGDEALKAFTVPVLAKIVQDNQVDEDFFASALTSLYRLDRVQGQAEIARVIDTSNDFAVSGAADVLAYDIELYKGDRAFDEAVTKVAERRRKDCQNDHILGDDELYFLRNAGYPVVPSSDLDEHDRDIGAFQAYAMTGDFVGSIVERSSNRAEVVRVQPLLENGSSLLVLYGDVNQKLWIELLPELAKLLKPIRFESLDSFDDAAPRRFTTESTNAWLSRFENPPPWE